MSQSMKLIENLPEEVVEHISSLYLPIKYALKNRCVSKMFRDGRIRSRDLDFSEIYSRRRNQSNVIGIIESIFIQHEGPKINKFVLAVNHIGVEDKILSWIKTCIAKNIQELVLDFSRSKKTIMFPIDLSSIDTLIILKLKWCAFVIPNNSPKGLKLLRKLSLMQTSVTKEMIDAIFGNCIHFESLELIQCRMHGILSINAKYHKNFKSLSVFSMPNLLDIILDAPTLECYKYEGYVRVINFSRVSTLKEALLHYNRSYDPRHYDPSNKVLANMGAYTRVYSLATTNIFLEALTYKYIGGEMRRPTFCFINLKEFQIVFKAPTICNLFDIAEFIQDCPNLERIVIDINGFTFEPDMYWLIHQKPKIMKHNYQLDTIKFVDINGYKNHSHELDMVEFFVKNAKSLKELKLRAPKNRKVELYEIDYIRINRIEHMSPRKGLIKFPED